MTSITPILLAGGSGTRLWPSSRKTYPKQFMQLAANETLFQQSAQRVLGSDILQFNQHIIITNSHFRFIVREQLQNVGINPGRVIIEPEPKNTAPAIIAATIFAQKDNKDAVIITTPTDHVISDTENFHQVIKIGNLSTDPLLGKILNRFCLSCDAVFWYKLMQSIIDGIPLCCILKN